jgi:hypothetical protein
MIYRRRHPERADYYRIIEANYEEFEKQYPDLFEEQYGYFRTETRKAIYAFLDCGIPENGMARIRCEKCGHDFFVAFSCRCRIICPSCSTKRAILFAEKIREMVKPISHIYITFTIPKLLRAYFRRNRKLLKLLIQSAHYATEAYFKEALGIDNGYTGGIYCLQSQGNLLNFHPHIHALTIAGIIEQGIFYEQTNIATDIIAEIFRARLLSVLQQEGIITEELVNLLMSWNHNSGFNVHSKGRITPIDGEAIGNIARYMSKAAVSTSRVEFNHADSTITVYENQKGSYPNNKATYTIMEFMALITSHIPSPYEALIYYYGVYSSSYRGKEKRNRGDLQNLAVEETKGKRGKSNGKITSTWARLIHRIFEVDILKCPKCGEKMRIIAFISDFQEIHKILRHIGEETIRPPPLSPAAVTINEPDSWSGDYIPPDEVYVRDEEYAY